MTRKISAALVAGLLMLVLCSCGKTGAAYVDCGNSEIYSKIDIETAASVVKTRFLTLKGCTLHYLKYAGDEISEGSLDYCKDFDKDFEKCIVFESSFQSPKNGGEVWNPDDEYTWRWYVAKRPLGGWKVVSYGYG